MAAQELAVTSLATDANLQSYWRFEGNSNDSKGTNNGTDTNITYGTAYGTFGQGALSSIGSTSKIVLTDNSSLKPSGNFTIGAWIKCGTSSGNQNLFQSYSANSNIAGFRVRVTGGGANTFLLLSGKNSGAVLGSDYQVTSTSGTVTTNTWRMVVGVYDGSFLRVYLDGVASGSTSWSNAPSYAATNYPRIACLNDTGSDAGYFNGAIDDMFLFNRALSATEISNLYNGSYPVISSTVYRRRLLGVGL